MKEVVMYIKTWCPYCKKVKALFDSKQVAYQAVDVEEETQIFENIKAQTGKKTVPQVFIDSEFVGGCDDVHALNDTGELDAKLGR